MILLMYQDFKEETEKVFVDPTHSLHKAKSSIKQKSSVVYTKKQRVETYDNSRH